MPPRLFLLLILLGGTVPAQAANPTWDIAAARHLVSRTGFSASPEVATRLAALPLEKAIDQWLDEVRTSPMPPKPDWVRDQWVNYSRRWADLSAEEYLILLRRNSIRNATELNDLKAWWLNEMIHSKSPLRESLTLFWHGHFTSATSKVNNMAQGFYEQNDLYRRMGMGNFRTFLRAATLNPAMLAYLDLEASDPKQPNENYARELLELFTLGVGNYTETDIREIARALTGWSLAEPPGTVVVQRPTAPDRFQFRSVVREGIVPRFDPAEHDHGEKTIFGKTGKFQLDDVLDMVVQHPACGPYLAGRFINYFGAHDPEGALRDRMARAFIESKYEIRPMLKVLFTSPEFYATESRGNQIKSPVRLLIGACRDLKLEGKATPALSQLTVPMGQELLNPPTVKGWPSGEAWISASTLALRFRLAESLIDRQLPSAVEPLGRPRLVVLSRDLEMAAVTLKRLLQLDAERKQSQEGSGLELRFEPARLADEKLTHDPEKLVDTIAGRLLINAPRPATREALIATCKEVPAAERIELIVRLILASPDYQVE